MDNIDTLQYFYRVPAFTISASATACQCVRLEALAIKRKSSCARKHSDLLCHHRLRIPQYGNFALVRVHLLCFGS
jgi:hypothetical protein